jgi:glycosyltransferase involved in cell wall biosynthesis
MLTGQDITFISSIEWNFVWQGHQEISLRLAAAGNRIFYIENTGIRSPGLGDVARVGARLKRWLKTLWSGGVREVAPNVWVCSPLVMPPFGAKWQRALNRRVFLPLIRRAARKRSFDPDVVWTYLPSDTALDLLQLLRSPKTVTAYYCGADFPELVPDGERLLATELELATKCDVVFTNCATLTQRFASTPARVRTITFGVDLQAFPFPGGETRPLPAALRDLPGPIVGYVGGLHRHLDLELLRELALARPEWSWVFVGPEQAPLTTLRGLTNVHLLGQKPHAELAEYIRGFDVCVIPYLQSAYTATVVPVKLNEYLAMGKPVVSTDLPMVREFNAQYGVLTTAPNLVAEFIAAIEGALVAARDPGAAMHRRRVAELGDWQLRLEEMCAALASPRPDLSSTAEPHPHR